MISQIEKLGFLMSAFQPLLLLLHFHSLLQLNTSDVSTALLIYLSPFSAAKILNFPLLICRIFAVSIILSIDKVHLLILISLFRFSIFTNNNFLKSNYNISLYRLTKKLVNGCILIFDGNSQLSR